MLRAFGHEKSSVLDGGLPNWKDSGLPLEQTAPGAIAPSEYPQPSLDHSVVRSELKRVLLPMYRLSGTQHTSKW